MAIPHARPGEAIDVRPLGPRLAGERTTALFKAGHLEVMRLVLPRSKALPPHAVAGDITVHCLEGRIDVTADGSSHVLEAGQLLYLLAGVSHSVVALEDSTALVTVALVR
jgi:quercetin dioxygenase-like cupin family protein